MDFWTRMRHALDKGVETSHDLFEKAKDRAQDLSRTGVLKYELMQLEDQMKKQLAKLGQVTYETLVEADTTTTLDTAGIRPIVDEITRLKTQIEAKEKELAAAGAEQASGHDPGSTAE